MPRKNRRSRGGRGQRGGGKQILIYKGQFLADLTIASGSKSITQAMSPAAIGRLSDTSLGYRDYRFSKLSVEVMPVQTVTGGPTTFAVGYLPESVSNTLTTLNASDVIQVPRAVMIRPSVSTAAAAAALFPGHQNSKRFSLSGLQLRGEFPWYPCYQETGEPPVQQGIILCAGDAATTANTNITLLIKYTVQFRIWDSVVLTKAISEASKAADAARTAHHGDDEKVPDDWVKT